MDGPPPEVPAGRYQGPAHAAPYGLSRMAPSFELVNIAEQIQKADETLGMMTGGKLGVIAEQIRRLQEQAHVILEKAQRDAELHRAHCAFEKRPGGAYHLYRRESGELWFSRVAPHEWHAERKDTFEGTYRLELDMSFTRTDDDAVEASVVPVVPLLGPRPR